MYPQLGYLMWTRTDGQTDRQTTDRQTDRQTWTETETEKAYCVKGIFFFEFDAGHGYDRSTRYMFGICVFWNSGYWQIHQDFWLMQMDLCPGLKLSMKNYARISTRRSLVPIRITYVLLGLSFSLDPVIQADTHIKRCCNFSRDSLTFKTDGDMYIWVSSA